MVSAKKQTRIRNFEASDELFYGNENLKSINFGLPKLSPMAKLFPDRVFQFKKRVKDSYRYVLVWKALKYTFS